VPATNEHFRLIDTPNTENVIKKFQKVILTFWNFFDAEMKKK